jgi:hypothetical protein
MTKPEDKMFYMISSILKDIKNAQNYE